MKKIEIDENKVISTYKNLKSFKKTAKYFNVSTSPIKSIINKHNIDKNSSRKYKCDFKFFENIDNEEKAYWLGFLYADGCIRKRKNNSAMILKIKDIDHLKKFNISLNSDYPIKPVKNSNCWYIGIYSRSMIDDLIINGCVPKKSLILEFPQKLDKKLYNHFIRGYFDGDGSISFNNKEYWRVVNIIGTYNFVYNIKLILEKNNIKNIGICKNSNIYYLYIQSIDNILKFRDFIYKNANIYLNRKYNKFEDFENEIERLSKEREAYKLNS